MFLGISWQFCSLEINQEFKVHASISEYGLQCYRKNPQHKIDYKHTSNSRASKRKASKDLKKFAKRATGNHLSGDDDEYESDFINDGSDLDDEDISSDEEDVDEWKPEEDD